MRSEIYTDTQGTWRWRLVADDTGLTMAGSGEGYANYAECVSCLDAVKAWAAAFKPQPAGRHLPSDPRSLVGMFDEPTAENFALLAMVDRLFKR
jgi:uncharacterized protein YegP (UPF0339 family)